MTNVPHEPFVAVVIVVTTICFVTFLIYNWIWKCFYRENDKKLNKLQNVRIELTRFNL